MLDPWVGKSPGGGNGNRLQYSCLENPHGQYMRSQSDMIEQLTRSLSSRKALGDSTLSGISLSHKV